jgi:tetratricopeptide (TPR) repeat protein/transglutaminase-like putative cysteine protease
MMRNGALLLALLSASGVAHAGDKPVYAPAPAWVKPAPPVDATALGEEAPIFVILDQQQRLEAGEVWSYTDGATRIASNQILNEAGTVKLPWQPDDGDLIVHRAEIVRGAEHIDLLASGDRFTVLRREEQLEQLQLNGMLTATMAVQGLRVGDVLRLTFSTTRTDKALAGGMQSFVPLLVDPMRAQFGRVRVLWPTGTDLRWKTYAEGLKPVPVQRGGYTELEFAVPLAKPAEMPTDMPMRFQRPPLLETSTFSDWASVSKVMAPLYASEGLIAPDSALASEVAKIVAREKDPRARAAAALRLVQDEVRYLFNGMQGGNYLPQKPIDTWRLRYGDCKAKSLLLLAMLRAMDIDAEAVLAATGMGDIVPLRLPSAGAFDHVLVRATIAGETLWLDGTTTGTRAADLGDVPNWKHVLPIRAAGAELAALKTRPDARPDMEVALDLDQSAGIGFPTLYAMTIRMRGQPAEMLKLVSSQAGKEQKEQLIDGMVSRFVSDSLTFDRSIAYDKESAIATITASGLVSSVWAREEGRYQLPLDRSVSETNFEPDRARPAWRDIPVATGEPFDAALRTRVRLPKDVSGFVLEGDTALSDTLVGVRIDRTAAIADGWITVDERDVSTGAEIAPADIAAMRSRVATAKTRLLRARAPAAYPARWEMVVAGRKDGRFDALRAAYAKAIAAEPDKALPYTNRASFLAGLYDWRGAIADLTRVIAIEPDTATYLARANYYVLLGEEAKALADFAEARKLDPGSARAVRQLAELHADYGRFDEALALIDERIAAGGKDKPDLLSEKADILAKAGRTEAALAAIDAAIASAPGNAALLNGRCWLKGILNVSLDTALRDCTKSIELAESPAAALDSRAFVYFRMGRTEDALADLQAALELAPGMGASLYMRGVIRKRAGDKAGDADLAAARLMSPRIDLDYARYGIKP